MKVLLFQPRFANLVAAGTKRQTIRPTRKIPIVRGDDLSLRQWQGLPYRSKQVELARGLCLGRALSLERTLVEVGPVTTTHPEVGAVASAPPPAPHAIRAMLPKLADLPAAAEKKARTEAELRDPDGTIWEHAKRLQDERDQLKADLAASREQMKVNGDNYIRMSEQCGKEIVRAEELQKFWDQARENWQIALNQRDGYRMALQRIADGKDAPPIDAEGECLTGLKCGVEDRDCQDRYQGAEYGYAQGSEQMLEWAVNEARAALAATEKE